MKQLLRVLIILLIAAVESYSQSDTASYTLYLDQVGIADSVSDKGYAQKNQITGIEELLDRSPSISLVKRGNYAMEPVINGFQSGQINVTIDGMRIFGACTDRMDPATSYVESINMKQADIRTGGCSAENGCSVGGNLDMKTRIPSFDVDKKVGGALISRYNSNSSGYDLQGQLNYSTEKLALVYTGGYRKHGNYKEGGGEEVNYSQFAKMNHSLKSSYRLAENQLLTFTMIYDLAKDVGYPALTMDVGTAVALIYGLGYLAFPENSWVKEVELKLYGNNIEHIMDDSKRPDVPIRMDMPGWSDTYGAFGVLKSEFGRHQFKGKLDYYYNASNAEMTMYPEGVIPSYMETWPDVHRSSVGLYLEDQYKHGSLDIMGSVRVEFANTDAKSEFGRKQFEIFGYQLDKPDQRAAYSMGMDAGYQFNLLSRLTFGVGYSERLPNVTEQFGYFLFNRFDNYDYVGKPDIDNEKALQAKVGFEHVTDKFQLSLEGFYYHMQDYIVGIYDPNIDRMTIGALGVKVFQNAERAYQMGFNASYSLQLLEALVWKGTAQYTRGEFEHEGEKDNIPMMLPLRLNNSLRYAKKKLFIQLENESSFAQNSVSATAEEQSTSFYAVFNVSAGYDFLLRKSRLNLQAGVDNILDRNYRTHLDWGGINRPGRNVYLSLGCYF
ncbi:TonB-dependent receptor [Aureibacter tunicatorum]|uniref:Iron complex outermembrane receptor protein n=1 Tax=Aureibacter tunicatorum TaxID=866807 RepID=A0AAE3XMW5_9BACT|nr:TonB-dependent receptor [Aureibacter tunicatorum]MDR6238696.1 iron complex outermembrane receptor protein [Aureibacter tunicatorum]BDD05373.1 TonB-dependent copper receptor [Aureibacter tunicatorum]